MVYVDVKHHVYLLRNQIWQSLKEAAGKRCSECACGRVLASEGDVVVAVDGGCGSTSEDFTVCYAVRSFDAQNPPQVAHVESVDPPFLPRLQNP